MSDTKISIITATYNAAEHLPRLIESLLAQTDQDFEWVVADGASTDGTLELLEQARPKFKRLIVDSRPDFGIYDALNRGVKLATGEFYLVLGADDELFPNGIETYKKALMVDDDADFISCRYYFGNKLVGVRKPRWEFLFSMFAHVTGHAVGLLIRKSLHELAGLYTNKLPLAADQLFVLAALRKGARVRLLESVVGRFSGRGTSGQDVVGALTESYRVQLMVGSSYCIQLILLFLRLLKNKQKFDARKG